MAARIVEATYAGNSSREPAEKRLESLLASLQFVSF